MYVCMYVCVYVLYVCVCVCMCVCMYVCMYVGMLEVILMTDPRSSLQSKGVQFPGRDAPDKISRYRGG